MATLGKDELPPELTADEWAALKATAMRGKLPATLTPSQMAALAHPDPQAGADRSALLFAICGALEAGELEPATPPRTLADLHPRIAARWSGDAPPFNPSVRLLFWSIDRDIKVQEISHGEPEHDFAVGIRREVFLAWSRTLGQVLPGAGDIRTRSPEDFDKVRSQPAAVLAELQRLPAWLTREEVLALWAAVEQAQPAATRSAKAAANRTRLDEALRSGHLPHHRATVAVGSLAAASQTAADGRGWHSPPPADRRPYREDADLPPMQASAAKAAAPSAQVWLHRDDLDAWLRGQKITLPADCLLRHWWPWRALEPRPTAADTKLRKQRASYGKASHAARSRPDWRTLVAAGNALMKGQGMTRSDAARRIARDHKLTGWDSARLSGQTKSLANKLGKTDEDGSSH